MGTRRRRRVGRRGRRGCPFAFSAFVRNPSGHFTCETTVTISRGPNKRFGRGRSCGGCGPLFVCNGPNLNGARVLGTVYCRVHGGFPRVGVLCIHTRSFTGRFMGTLRRGAASTFRGGFEGTSILLVSSVRFVTNGRTARRRFFRAFGALIRGKGRVILASSEPPGRVRDLARELYNEFRDNLLTSVRPPRFRAHYTVVGGGTRLLGFGVSGSIISFVTRGVGSGVERLRNAAGGLCTVYGVANRGPAATLTRGIVGSIVSGRIPPASIAMGEVVRRISEARNISRRSVGSSGRGTGVSRTEGVYVCVVHRTAALACRVVNGRFGGGCSAIVCDVGRVRGRVRGSSGVRHGIDSVVGGVGARWFGGLLFFRRGVFGRLY